MIKKGDIIELGIDSLAYGGEGVGKYNGLAVFVPDSVPGDKVKITIVSYKKSYARGIIQEIISPSVNRANSCCPLSKVCGGCQWQHIEPAEQLRAKKQIVEDSFKKIAHLDILVKDVIESEYNNSIYGAEYRCKVQYPVQQTSVSKRFLIGYYKKASHEIVNIKYCFVQPHIIGDITEFIRNRALELHLSAYDENSQKGLIRHIVFRYSRTNKNLLLIIVINADKIPEKLAEVCRAVKKKFPEVAGALINFNTSNTNVILGFKSELICGKDFITETLDDKTFKISAGSFFQVNPATAAKMFNAVKDVINERIKNPSILDVYAGAASFSIWLEHFASKVIAVEENPYAIKDAQENIKLNNIENEKIQLIEGNADKVLQDLANQGKEFDVIILDPPRKGCSQAVLDAVVKLTNRYIIIVSCNPTTLARDVKLLSENGFTPEFVQPVDMFCHTYHIESIVVMKKST